MNPKKRNLYSVCISVIALSVFLQWYELLQFKTDNINASVKYSNIRIVTKTTEEYGNSRSISYDSGSSGTVFACSGDTYYALTAEHVIRKQESSEFIILTENDKSIGEHMGKHGQLNGLDIYYSQFPKLEIIAADIESDLAIVSFESKQELTVLSLAQNASKLGDPIVTVSNPDGKHGVVSYGRVIDDRPKPVRYANSDHDVMIIKHSAHLSFGSSGSALLNKNYEIVGINVGGQRMRLFGINMSFMDLENAVPLETVRQFIKKSKLEIFNGDTALKCH